MAVLLAFFGSSARTRSTFYERNRRTHTMYVSYLFTPKIKGKSSRTEAQRPTTDAAQYFERAMLRIYSVLESHLSGQYNRQSAMPREYLAGDGVGKYSIADMGTWPHVRGYRSLGFSEEPDMRPKFPHLLQWIDRIAARPGVQKGIDAGKYDSEENPGLLVRAE